MSHRWAGLLLGVVMVCGLTFSALPVAWGQDAIWSSYWEAGTKEERAGDLKRAAAYFVLALEEGRSMKDQARQWQAMERLLRLYWLDKRYTEMETLLAEVTRFLPEYPRLAHDPGVTMWLASTMGQLYSTQKNFEKAEISYKAAIAIAESRFRHKPELLTEHLRQLAHVYRQQNKTLQAEALESRLRSLPAIETSASPAGSPKTWSKPQSPDGASVSKGAPAEDEDMLSFGRHYTEMLKRKIKATWKPLVNEWRPHCTVVDFIVNRKGEVVSTNIAYSSLRNQEVDARALAAIWQAQPFEPFPPSVTWKEVPVQFVFDYAVYRTKNKNKCPPPHLLQPREPEKQPAKAKPLPSPLESLTSPPSKKPVTEETLAPEGKSSVDPSDAVSAKSNSSTSAQEATSKGKAPNGASASRDPGVKTESKTGTSPATDPSLSSGDSPAPASKPRASSSPTRSKADRASTPRKKSPATTPARSSATGGAAKNVAKNVKKPPSEKPE